MTMKHYDESAEINHNRNWPYIRYYPYRILIIGGSGSGKTNALLNLIKHQRWILTKFISMLQIQSNQNLKVGIKKLKNPKALTDYSQTADEIFMKSQKTIIQKRKALIVFDDVIAEFSSTVTENTTFHLFLNFNLTLNCLKLWH